MAAATAAVGVEAAAAAAAANCAAAHEARGGQYVLVGSGRVCAAHVRVQEGECAPESTRGSSRRRAEARAPWRVKLHRPPTSSEAETPVWGLI